eukprot:313185-Amphidinium_carterae.1
MSVRTKDWLHTRANMCSLQLVKQLLCRGDALHQFLQPHLRDREAWSSFFEHLPPNGLCNNPQGESKCSVARALMNPHSLQCFASSLVGRGNLRLLMALVCPKDEAM